MSDVIFQCDCDNKQFITKTGPDNTYIIDQGTYTCRACGLKYAVINDQMRCPCGKLNMIRSKVLMDLEGRRGSKKYSEIACRACSRRVKFFLT